MSKPGWTATSTCSSRRNCVGRRRRRQTKARMKFSDEEMFAFACDFSSNSPQIFAHSIKILLATFAPILLCTSAASARPNEWSEREAAAEAQHDIHAHKIKFYWYGGYASMPIGVPARYFHIADRYPHADGGIGCSFMIARSGSDSVSI